MSHDINLKCVEKMRQTFRESVNKRVSFKTEKAALLLVNFLLRRHDVLNKHVFGLGFMLLPPTGRSETAPIDPGLLTPKLLSFSIIYPSIIFLKIRIHPEFF